MLLSKHATRNFFCVMFLVFFITSTNAQTEKIRLLKNPVATISVVNFIHNSSNVYFNIFMPNSCATIFKSQNTRVEFIKM